jgi:hypothetical protein
MKKTYLDYLQDDLNNDNLPKNLDNYDKIHCSLTSGKRIYWYFEEDLNFFKDEGEDIKKYKNDIFSGIIVGAQDVENNWGEINPDDCVIIMDQYPVEMSYPQFTWVALKRLIDDNNLVEIIE